MSELENKPAPKLVVRLALWFGLYCVGAYISLYFSLRTGGSSFTPLYILLPAMYPMPLTLPLIDLIRGVIPFFSAFYYCVNYGAYLLHLFLCLRAKRLVTFYAMLGILVVLLVLNHWSWGYLRSTLGPPD